MSQLLNDTIIDTVKGQEEKIKQQQTDIQEIQGTINSLLDYKQELIRLNDNISLLKKSADKISFPVAVMQNLSSHLQQNVEAQKQPTHTIHHHKIPTIILIAVGLFLVLCIVCMGWYNTATTLDQYNANDTKYRYLKLKKNAPLLQVLFFTDSLYHVDADMRNQIIWQEDSIENRRRQMELIDKKQTEINEIKQKLK